MNNTIIGDIKHEFTTMEHNKVTGTDEAVLHIGWDYFHAIHDIKPTAEKELTPWRLDVGIQKLENKENNAIVLAYYYKEQHGKKTRNIPVSCPKRLLEKVQKLGQEKYGNKFMFPPTVKKKVENESNDNQAST